MPRAYILLSVFCHFYLTLRGWEALPNNVKAVTYPLICSLYSYNTEEDHSLKTGLCPNPFFHQKSPIYRAASHFIACFLISVFAVTLKMFMYCIWINKCRMRKWINLTVILKKIAVLSLLRFSCGLAFLLTHNTPVTKWLFKRFTDVISPHKLDLHGEMTSWSVGVRHTEPAVILMSDENDVVRLDWGIYRSPQCKTA